LCQSQQIITYSSADQVDGRNHLSVSPTSGTRRGDVDAACRTGMPE
jgi:hypothetical protein